jgi:hypothetical protein
MRLRNKSVSSKHPKGMTQTVAFNAMAQKTDYDTVINAVNERYEERYTVGIEDRFINGVK